MNKFASHDFSPYIAHWGLTLTPEVLHVKQAQLVFGQRQGAPVVLKIRRDANYGACEQDACALALRQFAGEGAVRCIGEYGGALLLERLIPGTPLSGMVVRGADAQATLILCGVIRKLHTATAAPTGLPTVEQWGASFHSSATKQLHPLLPPSLLKRAARLYEVLCASQQNRRLLHGDLHHDNILFDHRRGWLAIDPKGVWGEPEYEIGAALRNPTLETGLYAHPSILRRRIETIASQLGLDKKRITAWCFAQAVLSSLWALEDSESAAAVYRGVAVARATLPLIEKDPLATRG